MHAYLSRSIRRGAVLLQPAEVVELRRLVGIWTSWDVMRRANVHYEERDYATAADTMLEAVAGGGDALLLYNLACYESLAGRTADAGEHLRQSIALDDSHRSLAAGDPDFDPIRAEVAVL